MLFFEWRRGAMRGGKRSHKILKRSGWEIIKKHTFRLGSSSVSTVIVPFFTVDHKV